MVWIALSLFYDHHDHDHYHDDQVQEHLLPVVLLLHRSSCKLASPFTGDLSDDNEVDLKDDVDNEDDLKDNLKDEGDDPN